MAMSMEEGLTQPVLALTFDYGQRAAQCEMRSAAKIAENFKIQHLTLRLPWFAEFSQASGCNNALLSESVQIPTPNIAELSDPSFTGMSAKVVWVPNRNGVFIEIAASIAESLGAHDIIVGFNREEAQSFPDNSTAYLDAINRALSFSTSNAVRVVCPTATLTKLQIVQEGIKHHFPFELLWSCYRSGTRMCGQCESCLRLKVAFAKNEIHFSEYFENTSLS
ncbi:MAG: 7-cyano-7-deazaguanine synthase QueC [Deltaproteobacteria bacterium]|nr:7-cyano-7-deazaguanine synthase QueC [Deltaproteobacteria bacterium]